MGTYSLSFIVHKLKLEQESNLPEVLADTGLELNWNPGSLPPRVLCCLGPWPIDQLDWRYSGWDHLFELVLLELGNRALLGFEP